MASKPSQTSVQKSQCIFLSKGNSKIWLKLQFRKFRGLRKDKVLLTCEFSWWWRQYIHTIQNTNLTSTQNIDDEIDKQL